MQICDNHFDGYAASSGAHTLEIRNRPERNAANTTGYKIRFKSLTVDGVYDYQTIKYMYDTVARVRDAQYYPGVDLAAPMTRRYQYAFDRSGNRTQQIVTIGAGAPTTTNYSYNNANQISNAGFAHDANGNLTNDGTNAYTWDRANRLLSMGGASHKYDGEGHRLQQTVGATVTKYLLDLQPGLSLVLSDTQGANVTRYVHGIRGIHAHKDASANWEWMGQDGLGSVRSVVSNAGVVLESRNYDPIGNSFAATGTAQTGYGFTGELVDGGGLLDVRARRYNPVLGILPSLDPFEGSVSDAMSLNGYNYVAGNPVNLVDPSGMIYELPSMYAGCTSFFFVADEVTSEEPCPSSPIWLITGNDSKDQWIPNLKFCDGGKKNNNLEEIMSNIRGVYGFTFPQRRQNGNQSTAWNWHDLASVANGAWLIARALQTHTGSSGEMLVKKMFGHAVIMTTGGDYTYEGSNLASIGLLNANTAALVPPPGVGGNGRVVFIRGGKSEEWVMNQVFVHELGHVIDFKLGSSYTPSTLFGPANPSTWLAIQTGGTYVSSTPPGTEGYTCDWYFYNEFAGRPTGNTWGLCLASQLVDSGYRPGGTPPLYGRGTPPNHFEDFAETWAQWILEKASDYRSTSLLVNLSADRRNFMDANIADFISRA